MTEYSKLILDIETTGKSRAFDQVVQVAYGWENEDGELVEERSILVKPSVPIKRGAFETHGISEDAVADCPSFSEAASELADWVEKAEVIETYNGNRFDIPILDAEFKRAGFSVNLSSKLQLDGLRLLQTMDPRDLSTMYGKFLGKPLEGAHDALEDIRATHALCRAMKSAFGLDSLTDHQIAHSLKGLNITVDGKLTWDKWDYGRIIFNYGKHSGQPIEWIIQNDPGYLSWIIDADKEKYDSITAELVQISHIALNGVQAFYQWVEERYGKPPHELHEIRDGTIESLESREMEIPEEAFQSHVDHGVDQHAVRDRQREIQAQDFYNQSTSELEQFCSNELENDLRRLGVEHQGRLQQRSQENNRQWQTRRQQRFQENDRQWQTRLQQRFQEIENRAWRGELENDQIKDEETKATVEESDWLDQKEKEATVEESDWLDQKEKEATVEESDRYNRKKKEAVVRNSQLKEEGLKKIREEIRERFGFENY